MVFKKEQNETNIIKKIKVNIAWYAGRLGKKFAFVGDCGKRYLIG